MSRVSWALALLGLASGCFLAAPDSLDWVDDDDDSGDDDDSAPDDDDSGPDDDDSGPDDDDSGPDDDGDGHPVPADCNDSDPTVYPDAPEIWDFQPNDCDVEPSATEVLQASFPDGLDEPGGIVHTGDWEYFGSSWSLGDVNGDGAEDLCARAEGETSGNVYVFLGIDALLSANPVLSTSSADVRVSPAHDAFGEVDCSRDLDGDGATDLVFSSVQLFPPDAGQGGIYVYDGGGDFVTGAVLEQWDASASDLSSASWTGRCWGIGQLDSDAELEIVYSALTNTAGGNLEPTLVVATPSLTPEGYIPIYNLDENFPGCQVVDDLSGDGTSEILIHDGDSRLVLGEDNDSASPPTWSYGTAWDGWWAESAVAADITGDGLRELIMGNPYWDEGWDGTQEGAVVIYFGRSGQALWQYGLEDDDIPDPDRMVWIDGIGPAGGLGVHVCPLGDPSGDGMGDFAVGSPTGEGAGVLDGEALVFTGRSEADWKALADTDGHIAPGKETSRFMGDEQDDVAQIGSSWGGCGYTWQSETADPQRIWWRADGADGEGLLLYWMNQRQ